MNARCNKCKTGSLFDASWRPLRTKVGTREWVIITCPVCNDSFTLKAYSPLYEIAVEVGTTVKIDAPKTG